MKKVAAFARKWLLLSLTLCLYGAAQAQTATTTQGTEFYVSFMPNEPATSPELIFRIIASAERDCQVSVYHGTGGLIGTFDVTAGGINEFVVNQADAYSTVGDSRKVLNRSLKIVSTDTISLYASNWTANSSDANNVLPTTALGSKYMAMSYASQSNRGTREASILVVATEDNTTVKIRPRSGIGYGATVTVNNMQAGQTYLYTSTTDLTGSIIEADDCKKIAVFSGHRRTAVPSGSYSSDHLVEQMLPLNSLGRKFVIIPTMDRVKDRYRIVAAENGTTFTVNGTTRTLNSGAFYEAEVRDEPIYVESNNPLAVCLYPISMGAPEGNKHGSNLGDNSMIWVNPVEQTLEDIIFAALPTDLVKNHYVNVLVNTADAAQTTLDGVDIGSSFQPVPGKAEYSYARIGIVDANKAHRLQNPKGLSAYVYGYGNAEAYGYTAGSSVKDLTLTLTSSGKNKEGHTTNFTLSGVHDDITIVSWQIGSDEPIPADGPSLDKLFEDAGCRDITVVYKQADNPCAEEQSITFKGATCIKPSDIEVDGILEVCEGDTVINQTWFKGSKAIGELRWYRDSLTSEYRTTSPISPFDATGDHTFYVSQFRSGVESDRAEVRVRIKPRPILSGVSDTVICEGMILTLNAQSNGSLTWYDSVGNMLKNSSILTVQPFTTTTYVVSSKLSNGCSVRKPVIVTVETRPMPKFAACNDTVICAGESVTLNAASSNGSAINWSTPKLTWNTSTILVSPSVTTEYIATAALDICVAYDTVRVTVLPHTSQTIDVSACESITLFGTTYTASGTHVEHLTNVAGCDSTLTFNFTILPRPTIAVVSDTFICSEDVITLQAQSNGAIRWTNSDTTWNEPSITISPKKTTTYMVSSQLGACALEQPVAVTVVVKPRPTLSIGKDIFNICLGDSVELPGSSDIGHVTWNGSTSPMVAPTSQSTYTARVEFNGCVRIKNILVRVQTPPTLTLMKDTAICAGQSIELTGKAISGVNSKTQLPITWSSGTPLVQPASSSTYTATVVEGLCSVSRDVTVAVKPLPTLSVMDDTAVCAGQSVKLRASSNGTVEWESAEIINAYNSTYYKVKTTLDGCVVYDSVKVTAKQPTLQTLTETACDTYTLNGKTYTESGTYTQSLTNSAGCDSTLTLVLTIKKSTLQTLTVTACDSYTLNGETYTKSGIYTQSLVNAAGCDSTLTLNLTINPLPTLEEMRDTSICKGMTLKLCAVSDGIVRWTEGSTIWSGSCATLSPEVTTTYTLTATSGKGCTVSQPVQVTVVAKPLPTLTVMNDTAICEGESLTLWAASDGLLVWDTPTELVASSSKVYNVEANLDGCIISKSVRVTVKHPTLSTITDTACDSYTLNGETYTASGTYTQNLVNAVGCDSTLTLVLTVNKSTSQTLTETACDSYTLNGETYTVSGTYIQHLVNVAGCDSTLTLILTVNKSTSQTLTEIACDSFTLNGKTYTASGTYVQHLLNAAGCDSTLTLVLTIKKSTSHTLTETVCESYTVNGKTYTVSGTYTQILTNAAGCDSVLTIQLTVRKRNQHIEGVADITKTYGDDGFTLSAWATSGLPVSYVVTAGDTDVIAIDDNRVSILSAGTLTLTVTQHGNGCYNATDTSFTITVLRADQTVSVADVEKNFNDSAFYLIATASSGLPLTFAAPAHNGIVNIDSSSLAEIVGIGTVQVLVEQAGSRLYNPASATFTITVNRIKQHIVAYKVYKTYGDDDFVLRASVNSGLPLAYKLVSGDDVIRVNDTLAAVLNAGVAIVEISQVGNAFYEPVSATMEVEVERAAQLLDPVANVRKFFDEPNFELSATSSSGLPVSFEIPHANGVVSLVNDMVSIEGVGKIDVVAVQYGNRNYLPDSYHFSIEVVDVPPYIVIQPVSHIGVEGDAYCLSVTATGTNLQYQWYLNGAAIEGATKGEYCIESMKKEDAGEYRVIVSNSAGADTSKTAGLTIYGIDEVLNMTKVYPNPTRGISTVENENLVMEEIILRDGSGNTIFRSYVNGSVAQFNVTGAPSGLYFLTVKTDKGTVIKRVMKIY